MSVGLQAGGSLSEGIHRGSQDGCGPRCLEQWVLGTLASVRESLLNNT